MKRYFDADALLKELEQQEDKLDDWYTAHEMYNVVKYFPTTDVVEVKHGQWLVDSTGAEYCSKCLRYPFDDGVYHISGWLSEYCPHCGAKMSGKETENVP